VLTVVNSVLLITAANAPLQSAQTVGVSSSPNGAGVASISPTPTSSPVLQAVGTGFDGALTVAQYQGAPESGFRADGSYFDVNVISSNLGAGSSVQVLFYSLTPGATVFWYNGSSWQPVTDASGQPVTADSSGTARVTLTTATSPTPAQLNGTEFLAGTFQPTLTAAAGPTVVVGAGVPLTDTATLAGGDKEAGTMTFTLYDASGKQVDVETVPVNGNGTYATPTGFQPTLAGAYQWVASYSSSNPYNSNAATTRGATPESAVSTGVTVVGNALWIVGGSANDTVQVKATGSSTTGSTGVQVQATLNGVSTTTSYSQSFSTLDISLSGGNENVRLAPTLTINAVVSAGNGNDRVQLGNGNNVVTLGNGNDSVQAGGGNNTVTAGNGIDLVQLANGKNVVTLGNGNDTVQAGNGNNVVTVGNGSDSVTAGNGNNTVVATTAAGHAHISLGNGSNTVTVLDSSAGQASVRVGDGNNIVVVGNGKGDQVHAGKGANIISVGNGTSANVQAGDGNNIVTLGNGGGTVHVGNGDNLLIGGLGQDSLTAGKGNNILIDGSVNLSPTALINLLAEWIALGTTAAAQSDIRSGLSGAITYNSTHANTLDAGSGLDWFWEKYAQDKTNKKAGDLLN
jgi:hypothetical protein